MPNLDVTTMAIQFHIHGAICHTCDSTRLDIKIYSVITESLLAEFYATHGEHDGFAWSATIADPPAMVTGQLIEMKFTGAIHAKH